MAAPSWSFANGVISDSSQPGWNYDLNKQKGSAQNLDQAMTLAKNDWQSKFDPGRLLMSNDLTATSQGIGKQAADWGAGQTWNTAGNPMASRPDLAPSTAAGVSPGMQGLNAQGQVPLNAQGKPQGTPAPYNALTGQKPNLGVSPPGTHPITESLDSLTSPADKAAALKNQQPNALSNPDNWLRAQVEPKFGANGKYGANPMYETRAQVEPNPWSKGGNSQQNFDIRAGSNDPNVNHQVYGTNYFPGNLPGFPGISNKEQFFALTPQQQGDYRVALANSQGPGQGRTANSQGPGQGGTAPPGSQPSLTPDETANGTIPPRTGPGAGRGYPSNWNANNNPALNGDTTFATNPTTGASYETSPMYQFQQAAGEKAINRSLRARGRFNSSVGVNALANFNNQLGASEADKQYNRVFDQQKLGMQAALAQAQSAGASAHDLAQLYAQMGGDLGAASQRYGMSVVDLIKTYGTEQAMNMLTQGREKGAALQNSVQPSVDNLVAGGANKNDLYTFLASLGIKGYEQYKAK